MVMLMAIKATDGVDHNALGRSITWLLSDNTSALHIYTQSKANAVGMSRLQTQSDSIRYYGCDNWYWHIIFGEFVVAGGDTAEIYEPAEHGFHHPSGFVARFVEADRSFTGFPSGDDWLTRGRSPSLRSAAGRQEAEIAGPHPFAAAVGDVAHHTGLGELFHQQMHAAQ